MSLQPPKPSQAYRRRAHRLAVMLDELRSWSHEGTETPLEVLNAQGVAGSALSAYRHAILDRATWLEDATQGGGR